MSEKFSTLEDKVSYGIGRQMGKQLAGNPLDRVEIDAVIAGLRSGFFNEDGELSDEELKAAFEEMNALLQERQAEQAKALAAEGEKFLAENAGRDGIVVTESGLQYEVITEGSGDKPGEASRVRTHYHGTFIDGSVFDSSYDRGEPAEFPVNGVIPGWTEALQMMPTGSKWRIYLPHQLAYGEHGAGDRIAPYTTLVFDIELLDIVA
ncbi:MAG: FKBP-type peptidyl-prolyl cis-trans isomerase [Pseudomonadales bacterium]|jgi:FKBP-type peptidyl-prolyl cis-trans isomerase FklB